MADANRYTAKEIWANIEKSDAWLYRGILAIYDKQTEDEQVQRLTREQNGIGFNASDAKSMSYIAAQLKEKGWIYPNQISEARRKLRKYAGQLARISRDKRGS